MKITSLNVRTVRLDLAEPYTIAYETVSSTENVFLQIRTDTGLTGYGCAAPDREVTGETADSVNCGFEEHVRPVLTGRNPLRHALLIV